MTVTDEDFAGFADDLDGVIPDSLVDNTYLCELFECKLTPKNHEGRRFFLFKWRVIEDGDFYGEEIGPEIYWMFSAHEYEQADRETQAKMKKARRSRIARLESLGISKDKLADTEPDDLVGKKAHVTITVRPRSDSNQNQIWVNNVELASSVKDTLTI